MSTGGDDLPPIPSERIYDEVVREGGRRRMARGQRRQRLVAIGGGLVATAVLVTVVAGLIATSNGGDDADDAATDTGATTGGTTAATEAEGTTAEATEATEATEGTEAPGTTTAAAATDAPGTTGAPATTAATAATDDDVIVTATDIWERPPEGGIARGPTTFEITYAPSGVTLASAEVVGAGREPIEMTIADNVATTRIGPFRPGTVVEGGQHLLGLAVRSVDADGQTAVVRPGTRVILRDCTP